MPPRPATTSGHLTLTRDEDIAHVRLERPAKLNALTLPMIDDLVAVGRALRRDGTLRAVVLSGEGEAFCAGLDLGAALADPRGIATRFAPRPAWGTNVFQEACWVWRRLPVPVVAAVHGHCLGAGLQLALGADLRLTSASARWSVREARWGLVPDMTGTVTLPRLVGADVAAELTLSARTVTGEEAHRLGLATGVVEEDDVLPAARDLLAPMLVHDRTALARAKRLLVDRDGPGIRRALARERRAQLGLLARRDRNQRLPGSQPATT